VTTSGETDPLGGGKPDASARERNLIEEALRQGTPRAVAAVIAESLPPDGTFPGYELIREIHRGGQGVVYQAIQTSTRQKVAVKVLHGGPFSGSSGRSRFEREVQVLGQLNHPNIVGIHDSGVTADGSCFYVMDYIAGRTLDEVIASGKLSIEETLKLFAKICDAVNAAHLKGIIHRDLKPANIRIDGSGEPIVVDFGLAKIVLPDMAADEGSGQQRMMSMTGQFIGSLPWASPEQAEGIPGNIDVRTDVYSLGVVMYQMLTGQFPYAVVGKMRDVLDNILRAEPARPSTVRRQVNDEVETIVLKCLSKERERRYQSAGELGRDIHRYLKGEPIEAKRDSGLYMMSKALRRYRAAALVACGVLVLSTGFSIAMAGLYRRASAARVEAVAALASEQVAREKEAAQRARAEENFEAGHRLAMRMMTDLHDEIADLRGATGAREMVLEEALAYVSRLRAEAGDDPSLLRDLADGHERVSKLQGGAYRRRLAETAAAAENQARAREIRAALLARFPDEARSHADMAQSLLRSGQLKREARATAEARSELELASVSIGSARRLAGADVAMKARLDELEAEVARSLGDIDFRLAEEASRIADAGGDGAAAARSRAEALVAMANENYATAERIWNARLAADSSDRKVLRALGTLADERSEALVVLARAQRSSLEAAGLRTTIESIEPPLALLREARALGTAALVKFDAIAESRPADGVVQRDRYLARHAIGVTWMEEYEVWASLPDDVPESKEGRREARAQAMNNFLVALGITRNLASTDSRSLEAQRDVAICLNKVGNEFRDIEKLDEARAHFAESRDIRVMLYRTDPIPRHRLDLARGLFKLGDVEVKMADKATDSADMRKHLQLAVGSFQEAMQHFQELVTDGAIAANARDVTLTSQRLEAARARLK
jgi:predicted Ser/Thr protein kinase